MKNAEAKLMFSGARLYLLAGASVFTSFGAVSGQAKKSGETSATFSYGKESQKRKDSGPLPDGDYMIDLAHLRDYEHTGKVHMKAALAPYVSDMTTPQFYDKMDKAWGRFDGRRGQIVPILNTKGGTTYAHGRNNAWIHGSHSPGSIGCIDLGDMMDNFVAALLELTRDSSAKVPLIVRYGLTPNGREVREVDLKGRDISRVA